MAGYVCGDNINPSVFFLDVINGDSTAIQSQQGQGQWSAETLKPVYENFIYCI